MSAAIAGLIFGIPVGYLIRLIHVGYMADREARRRRNLPRYGD